MSAHLKFVLVSYVSEPAVPEGRPHITSNVQVWDGKQHITTVDVADTYFDWPDGSDRDTIENYAVLAARVLARHLSEVQMRAVEDDTINPRSAFTMENKHA